jgi:hypothetical protein
VYVKVLSWHAPTNPPQSPISERYPLQHLIIPETLLSFQESMRRKEGKESSFLLFEKSFAGKVKVNRGKSSVSQVGTKFSLLSVRKEMDG